MHWIRLFRISQWIKNTFVFLPLFFAGRLFEAPQALWRTAGIGLAFCLVASGIYILNDFLDREDDRQHPLKQFRPLAAGKIPLAQALSVMTLLFLLGFCIALPIHTHAAILLGVYLLLNIAYSLRLKHIPILDVSLISVGFLLRIFAGGQTEGIFVSKWLILMTFLLALFLGFAKRRDDVLLFNQQGTRARKSIDGYSLEFINICLAVMAAVTIVAYIMYTVSDDALHSIGNSQAYLTTIFVILGILRYLQITMVEQKSGAPTQLFWKDRFLQLTLLGWILSYYFFLYLSK